MALTEQQKLQNLGAGGSPFADVSTYLSANQPQAQRLASNIGQNVVNSGNQVRQNLNTAQGTFNTQANASRVPYDPAIGQRAQQDPRSFFNYQTPTPPPTPSAKNSTQQSGGKKIYATSGNNPVNYISNQAPGKVTQNKSAPVQTPVQTTAQGVANQADIDAFNKMRDATYTGPTDLSSMPGYGDLLNQEQGTLNLTNQLGNQPGQQALLESMSGKPVNALDQYLLQNGPASTILKNSGAQNADIANSVENANTAAGNLSTDVANQNAATKAQIAQNEGSALSGLKQDYANDRRMHGKFGRLQGAYNMQTDAQKLDALNRLMGSNYTLS